MCNKERQGYIDDVVSLVLHSNADVIQCQQFRVADASAIFKKQKQENKFVLHRQVSFIRDVKNWCSTGGCNLCSAIHRLGGSLVAAVVRQCAVRICNER